MTTTTEVKWEEIDSLEKLKVGDEVEYKCPGDNRMFTYWGEVIDIQRTYAEITAVRMSGDWTLLPSSLVANEGKNKLTRKVVEFVWPDYVGACVEATMGDTVHHYVRVAEAEAIHRAWVDARTGEFYATWELELVAPGYTHRVLGRGY